MTTKKAIVKNIKCCKNIIGRLKQEYMECYPNGKYEKDIVSLLRWTEENLRMASFLIEEERLSIGDNILVEKQEQSIGDEKHE